MTFPDQPFDTIADFTDAYALRLSHAMQSVNRFALAEAADVLGEAYRTGRTVFACGNGGSAAISNHLHCDHLKGIQTDTALKPRVVSIVAGIETITAIANDISYDDVFVYQLRTLANEGDVLVATSSSGSSANIVKVMEWAKENAVKTIALTGFDGGTARSLADVSLHVDADNYGVIEDAHQAVMHILAQYLRLDAMPENLVPDRKF